MPAGAWLVIALLILGMFAGCIREEKRISETEPQGNRHYVVDERMGPIEGFRELAPRRAVLEYAGTSAMQDEWGRPIVAHEFRFPRLGGPVNPGAEATHRPTTFFFHAESGRFVADRFDATNQIFFADGTNGPLVSGPESALFLFLVTQRIVSQGGSASLSGHTFTLEKAGPRDRLDGGCETFWLNSHPSLTSSYLTCLHRGSLLISAEINAAANYRAEYGFHELVGMTADQGNAEAPPPPVKLSPWHVVGPTPAGLGELAPQVYVPPVTANPDSDNLVALGRALYDDPRFDAFAHGRTGIYLAEAAWPIELDTNPDLGLTMAFVTVTDGPDSYVGFFHSVETAGSRAYVPQDGRTYAKNSSGPSSVLHDPSPFGYQAFSTYPAMVLAFEEIASLHSAIMPARPGTTWWLAEIADECAASCQPAPLPATLQWAIIEDCTAQDDAQYMVVSAITGQLMTRGPVERVGNSCFFDHY